MPMQMPAEVSSLLPPSSSYLHRHRLRRQREEDGRGSVQDTLDRLDEATSHLASAVEAPLPHVSGRSTAATTATTAYPAAGLDGQPPRSKRRKLDGDPLDMPPAVRYGFHGQVVAGRLQMQLVSCDGGAHSERNEPFPHRHYAAANVLRNDKSVYCSEKDRCNLVLRHVGETCFTMTKLVIKTPDAGFNAP